MAKNSDRPAPVAATGVAMGGEQHGQGSSTQECRRLVESFQRRAQPVGGDGDDRTGPAPHRDPGRSCSLIWPSRWSSPSSRPGYATTALHGVLVFAGLFSSVWWAWAGFTFYANRFDTDDVVYRRQVGSHACCRRAGRQRQRRDRVAGRTVRVFVMPPSGWCWSPSICVPMTVAWTAFMARSERRMLTAYPALPPSTWAYAHHPGSSFALQRHPWLPDPICLTRLAFSRLLSTIQFHQGQPCDDAAARWTAMQDPQWRSILCSGRVRAQQPVVEQGGPDVPDPRALLPTG
jgi:hypothetical protein